LVNISNNLEINQPASIPSPIIIPASIQKKELLGLITTRLMMFDHQITITKTARKTLSPTKRDEGK